MPRFDLVLAADGTARVHGTIRLNDESGRRLLVAMPGDTQASCGDADEDGVIGVTGFKATFRDIRARKRIRVELATVGPEIEATGVYPVTVKIGEEAPLTGNVHVRVKQGRPARRR